MSNAIKTTVLLGLLTGLLLWIGQWLGGPQGLVVALVFAAAMNFGSYWFADRIVLAMYGARELSEQDAPELFRIVRDLNEREGLTVLVVEQNAHLALQAAASGYVLEAGRVVLSGSSAELRSDDSVRRSYLGY